MSMSKGQQTDPYAVSRNRAHYNNVLADLTNKHVREIEISLLRAVARSELLPIGEAETPVPGGGIVVVYDNVGRTFKIEITQVDGPR